MRVRVHRQTTFAFGASKWGVPLTPVPVLAGSVVSAECIQRANRGQAVAFWASSPAYVECPDGTMVTYTVEVQHVREVLLDAPNVAEAWAVWLHGHAVTDVRL